MEMRECPTEKEVFLALAPADGGVAANGGRIGARWAPASLLAVLRRMALDDRTPALSWATVTSQIEEAKGSAQACQDQITRLRAGLRGRALVHLGGGHDHVFPLLAAVGADRPVVVINVDAHCDTRTDASPHSGNPFRRFDQEAKFPLRLHQIGVHPFANSVSTLSKLPRGEMRLHWRDDCRDAEHTRAFLMRVESEAPPEAIVVFSLDCDALANIAAVSAPNHDGLPLEQVHALVDWYHGLCRRRGQSPVWGVYEYNPLYDGIGCEDGRVIAGLIHRMITGG